jgi:quercetin dioxygenase-like cupin family protein
MLNNGALFVNAGEWQSVAPGVQRRILGYDDAIMMVAVRFENGAVGAMHDHPHRQVTYVADGEFEVVINGETALLRTGDSFFVPPGARHGVVALSAGTLVDAFTPAREDFVA